MTSFPLVADISNYQPDEPAFFQALKNQGVKAVIVKITQGSADGMPISILEPRRR